MLKKMREIIKKHFKNIESKLERLKRAIQEASKETPGYAKRATPLERLITELIHLAAETRKLERKQRCYPEAARHHNYLCSEVKRRTKKDRELYVQVLCKEVEIPRFLNKTHLVYEAIR